MTRSLPAALLASALALSLAACKRDPEPVADAPAPAPQTTPPTPAPATPAPAGPAATANAQVVAVEVGTGVDDGNRITAPATTFKPNDTIYVSVATRTADPAASVPARLTARWSKDDQVIHEQPLEVTLTGEGQTAFKIDKPSGFPAGGYRVDILLDDRVVQSREFTVAD